MPTISRLLPALLFSLCLLAGCGSLPRVPPTANAPAPDSARANEVLFGAMNLVGTPYHYGGNTPDTGFDCSGLAGYVYRTGAGISLPRTVSAIDAMPVPAVGQDELAAGDLLIFATGRGRRPDHTGIYVGQQRFVHAPSRGGTVRLDRLDEPYWQGSFLRGKRPLAGKP